MTLANKITVGRFFISLVLFAILLLGGREPGWILLDVSALIFLVAVISDAVDGYYARKYAEVTNIGRIADPLVDKVVICGSLILFQGIPVLADVCPPWMLLVIVCREFFVTGVRSVLEARSIPFGASGWGKTKMVIQSIAVTTGLVYAAHVSQFGWARTITWAVMIFMTGFTFLTGIIYLADARRALR